MTRSRIERAAATALSLASVTLCWLVLVVVARVPTTGAVTVTNVLFVVALPLTYGAVFGAVITMSSRPRLATLRVVSLTLSLILVLGVLELAAATRLVHWELLFMSLRGEGQDYVADPELGFRRAPSTRWSGRPRSDIEISGGLPASTSDRITITRDQLGYRNATHRPRADIILIGDSYVEGMYVSDNQIVSSFLQARLHRPVANLGVAGYGASQELIVLKHYGIALKPEIVIWFFFEGNDLYNDHAFENTMLAPRGVRETELTAGDGWWRRSFLRHANAQLRLLLYPLVPAQYLHFGTLGVGRHRGQRILFWPEAAFLWTDFEYRQWERTRETLRVATGFARKHNLQLLLVYVPMKFRVYRDFLELAPRSELRDWTLSSLPDLFARFCQTDGLACLDLTELFRDSVRDGGMPYAPADSHWSAEGHELVALRLERALQVLGWVSIPDRTAPAEQQASDEPTPE